MTLETKHLVLRAVGPDDYPFLFELLTTDDVAANWRRSGGALPPEDLSHDIWAGVHAQQLIVERSSARPIGLISALNADLANGHVSISMAVVERFRRTGAAVEASEAFIGFLFSRWAFRKIYAWVPEFNMSTISDVERPGFVVEGRLKEHVYRDGKHWDMLILALDRERWQP